jgi:BirA family biotin operon repressor/biotin-[acetyl-CoA-carboxylase] ligase
MFARPFAMIDTAQAAALRRALRTRWLGREARVHATLPSTQDEARRLAAAGAPEGTVVWALEQTAGRGRADRTWLSPPGCGLWFSLVLRPPIDPARAAFLGIVTGVALADALRRRSGADVRLKWPNDLRVGGRKLGGILAEASLVDGAVAWVVVGAGINLLTPAGGFPAPLEDIATALDSTGPEPPAAAVLATCLAALERRYEELISEGTGPARKRWLRLSDTIGQTVAVDLGARKLEGVATDLAADGALVIRTAGGTERVTSGEVVHLRSAGS